MQFSPDSTRAPRSSFSKRVLLGDVMAASCPSRELLQHLTSKWGVLIQIALLSKTMRFSELRRSIGGVSERMLAQTLQVLESDGMVLRSAKATVPPHVEYSLTPIGRQAAERIKTLVDWLEESLPDILASRTQHSSDDR